MTDRKAGATATANAGVLRFAQDDGEKQATATATATAKATATTKILPLLDAQGSDGEVWVG
jgi:hypothetical protein